MNILQLIESFKTPDKRFRGKPFMAWNGTMDPEELRRQVRLYKIMGFGGFFIHSRVGLNTVYLSKKWFECVNTCIDEAEKEDLEVWLYDDDRWPSGTAGGLVTNADKYRARHLVCSQVKDTKYLSNYKNILGLFKAEINDYEISNLEKLPINTTDIVIFGNECLLVFTVKIDESSLWFNGGANLNTLDSKAVREFIKITHEKYRKYCGQFFGNRVSGIFTDEPNRCSPQSNMLPWTDKLAEQFYSLYGYDILDHLPELFFDFREQEISQARWHYHDCATRMFVDAYSRQLGEWCAENKLIHTGHILHEQTISSQTRAVGSCMRFYEHMQIPGMDVLTEYWREYDTAKQVASAGRQFGKNIRLTECYGCTGWDFTFAGHKAICDWQVALGINMRCHHLAWYTMEGQAKRDYPASISYQSPWWKEYRKVEDYFARIHSVMSQGVEVRDLLVIHPVESAWTRFSIKAREVDNTELKQLDATLVKMRDSLLAANIDFDYGDEDIISRYGNVKGTEFHIAQAQYKAVLVPELDTIRSSTLKLLKKFNNNGGTVIFAGDVTRHVDALPSDKPRKFAEQCIHSPLFGPELIEKLEPDCRRISMTDSKGYELEPLLHLLREDETAFYLFICNTGHNFTECKTVWDSKTAGSDIAVSQRTSIFPEVKITGFSECAGKPFELDPNTGHLSFPDAMRSKRDFKWHIKTSFEALASRIFVIPKSEHNLNFPNQKILNTVGREKLGKTWEIALSEPNVLLLDCPIYSINGKNWTQKTDILLIDDLLRDKLNTERRSGQMSQPWTRIKTRTSDTVPIWLQYDFYIEKLPEGEMFLAVEQPENFKIELNGIILSPDTDCGWWVDKSLRKISFDSTILKSGRNDLILYSDFNETQSGLEAVYILGDFGVELNNLSPRIISPPRKLNIGDWVEQGFCFYSGSVIYRKKLNLIRKPGARYYIKIPEYNATAIRVLVDNREIGIVAWPPNKVEVTDYIIEGETFILCLELFSSRRNSHGPFHYKDKKPIWTGPAEFKPEKECRIDTYHLVPYGIMKEPELITRITPNYKDI